MSAPGTPRSVELFIRTEAVEAFDQFDGATISDRMLAAVAEVERLRSGDPTPPPGKYLSIAANLAAMASRGPAE